MGLHLKEIAITISPFFKERPVRPRAIKESNFNIYQRFVSINKKMNKSIDFFIFLPPLDPSHSFFEFF